MKPASATVALLPLLVPACLGMITGCASFRSDLPNGQPPTDTGPPAALTAELPAPSALKDAQSVSSSVYRPGGNFMGIWPNQRVTPTIENHGAYLPDFDTGLGSAETAYAIYLFDATGFDHASTITVDWVTAGGDGEAWVGMADFTADTWRWHLLGPEGIAHFDAAACLDDGFAYAMVVLTGTTPRQLASIHLGFAQPPVISGVSPLSGEAGAEITLSTILNIPEADVSTWHWDLDGAGSIGTSSEARPTLTLGAADVYQCSVRASNVWGESDLYFLLTVNAPGSAWHNEGVDIVGMYHGTTSLALEPGGDEHPHIAYLEYDDPYELRHACYDGAAWHTETLDSGYGIDISSASLAINDGGTLYLAYAKGDELPGAWSSHGVWHFMTIDFDQYEDWDRHFAVPYLAIDNSGWPHVSYQISAHFEGVDEHSVCYKSFDGSAWSGRARPAVCGSWTEPATFKQLNPLELRGGALPRIPYFDDLDSGALYYLAQDGEGSWSEETVETDVNIEDIAFGISRLDWTPRICYVVRLDPLTSEIRYARFDGSSWQVTALTSPVEPRFWLSLTLDSLGWPHICYDELDPGTLMYASFNGLVWHHEVVDPNGGGLCDIALDSADNPHISYLGSPAWCIRYACKTGS